MRRWWTATLFVGLVAMPATVWAKNETLREQSRFERDVNGITSVGVENARGLVDVRPSADGRLRVTALKIVRSMSPSLARELASQTTVETDLIQGAFLIRVHYPAHRVRLTFWGSLSSDQIPSSEVRLSIELPQSLPVVLTSASGDLNTDGMTGTQTLRAASGDVHVDRAGGFCEVTTASGDVSLDDVASTSVRSASGDVTCDRARGWLQVSTTSGDVTVQAVSDSVRVSTVSGDVRLEHAPRGLDVNTTSGQVDVAAAAGRVRVRAVSGDVDVALQDPLGRSDVETQSGALTVRFDERISCAIDASSTSGEVDFRLPVQARTLSRGRVAATLRGGATPVHLRSVSGDINVMGGGR